MFNPFSAFGMVFLIGAVALVVFYYLRGSTFFDLLFTLVICAGGITVSLGFFQQEERMITFGLIILLGICLVVELFLFISMFTNSWAEGFMKKVGIMS